MRDSLPFAVSSEVEEWLLRVPSRPDMEPGFCCSPRYGVYHGKELVEDFTGEHYVISFVSREAWLSLSAVQVVIATRAFWLDPETLNKLRGKTLTVIQADVSRRQYESKMRAFIVAA